jgi:hypothetical protein
VTSDSGLRRFVRAVDAIRVVSCRSVPRRCGPALPIVFPSGMHGSPRLSSFSAGMVKVSPDLRNRRTDGSRPLPGGSCRRKPVLLLPGPRRASARMPCSNRSWSSRVSVPRRYPSSSSDRRETNSRVKPGEQNARACSDARSRRLPPLPDASRSHRRRLPTPGRGMRRGRSDTAGERQHTARRPGALDQPLRRLPGHQARPRRGVAVRRCRLRGSARLFPRPPRPRVRPAARRCCHGGRDSPRHGRLRTAAWRRQSLYRRGQQPPLRRASHGRTRHRRTAPPLGRISREFLTWRRAGSGMGALTSTNGTSFGASGGLTTALTGVRGSSRPLGRRRAFQPGRYVRSGRLFCFTR